MLILVSSFPRSGTHLTIDSLCKNVPNCLFPRDARLPRDFNYGSLLRNTETVTAAFRQHIDPALHHDTNHVVIKSHLMPSVIERMLQASELNADARQTLADIWRHAAKIYVYRDVRDVMVSRYHHQRAERQISFAEFLRQQPDVRGFGLRGDEEFAQNRVALWAQHVREWLHLEGSAPPVVYLKYEDLVEQFETSFATLARALQLPLAPRIAKPAKGNPSLWNRLRRKLRDRGLNLGVESTAFLAKTERRHWTAYFSPEDLAFVQRAAGAVSAQLGYRLDAKAFSER
jgi:hypothetical protein